MIPYLKDKKSSLTSLFSSWWESYHNRHCHLLLSDIFLFCKVIWRERPPWLDPDPKPDDLVQGHNLLIASANPNIDPTRIRGHLRSFTDPSERPVEYGLNLSSRKSHHRSTTVRLSKFQAVLDLYWKWKSKKSRTVSCSCTGWFEVQRAQLVTPCRLIMKLLNIFLRSMLTL